MVIPFRKVYCAACTSCFLVHVEANSKSYNNKTVVLKYLSLDTDRVCANIFFSEHYNYKVVNKCTKILLIAKGVDATNTFNKYVEKPVLNV